MKKTYRLCQMAMSLLVCSLTGCGFSQTVQESSPSSVTAETVLETSGVGTEPIKEMSVINETAAGTTKEAAETVKNSSTLIVWFSR